nr:DUF456 family protein [Angustibacter aerolatus]
MVKYVLPGRRLKDAGVPWWTTLAGVALGVVGFFVVPVVGLLLGFVLGVYLAEPGPARLPRRRLAVDPPGAEGGGLEHRHRAWPPGC